MAANRKRIRVGFNGMGRIGRNVLRIIRRRNASGKGPRFIIRGINDLMDNKTIAHLIKYDSILGVFPGEIKYDDDAIYIDGLRIPVSHEKDPANIPWKKWGVRVVMECTGAFRKRSQLEKHIKAGARQVLLSVPPDKEEGLEEIPQIVIGVNDNILESLKSEKVVAIVSDASCTTNCLAPLSKAIDQKHTVLKGYMVTVHAFTNDQNLTDGPHKDLSRAASAAMNLLITKTGAATAIGKVYPQLDNKMAGACVRTSLPDVSLVVAVYLLKENTTAKAINTTIKEAEHGSMKGILATCEDDCGSTAFLGRPESCIVATKWTTVVDGDLVAVYAWYDNEVGYSERMLDTLEKLAA